MISKQTIDEIFQTARVEEVIGDFVTLKRSGSNYKAKSPFVDEKTPSFMISPAKQIWKCFSSGKGGNVVSFLMEHEHFSYVEALRWLANRYNIAIKEDRQLTPEEIAQTSLRENLSLVNEFARDHFVHNMFETDPGKAIGLAYFKERGFRESTIKKFELGYCLNESENLTKAALEKGYKLDYLQKTGLTKVKEDRYFDFFRGRVMFPIHSVAGKVLGFGGRTLRTDKKIAKYFNSPESELYNKSKVLYGLYFSKNTIIKKDECFLVEGYTDVISLHQSGIENVVASSGTSLTDDQIKLVKRYTDNITMLYDGDAAGIKASFRGIDMILESGMNVKVVLFPDGEDPDSFAKKSTAEELEQYISQNANDFIHFKSDILLKDAGNDPIKKAELIRDIVGSIAVIPDAIKRQIYARECANLFEMQEQVVVSEIMKIRGSKHAKSAVQNSRPNFYDEPPPEALIPEEYQTKPKFNRLYDQERDLIRLLMNYGTHAVRTKHVEEDEDGDEIIVDTEVSVIEFILFELKKDQLKLKNEDFQRIIEIYQEGLDNNIFCGLSDFTQNVDPKIAKVAVDIATSQHEISPNWTKQRVYVTREIDKLDKAVLQATYSYKIAVLREMKEELQKEIIALFQNDEINRDEINTLQAKQIKLDAVIMLLSEKLGRIII